MDASHGDRVLLTERRIWLVSAVSSSPVWSRVELPRQSYTGGKDRLGFGLVGVLLSEERVDLLG